MPTYEFRCKECRKKFSKTEKISEHATRPKCPKCGSRKTEQLFGEFYAKTVRKS